MTDITPAALMYAGFNNGTTTTPSISWDIVNTPVVYDASGKISQGIKVEDSLLISSNPVLTGQRGSMAFWIRMNSTADLTHVIWSYQGTIPFWSIDTVSGTTGYLNINLLFDGNTGGAGGVHDSIASDSFNFKSGDWHHFVWVWQGTHHRLYRNGALVRDKIVISPFPYTMASNFAVGGGFGSGQVTVDELAVYNYPLNATDVAAAYGAVTSAAISASGTYGLDAVALWAPGDGNVFVMADAGNEYATRVHHYDVTIKLGAATVATATISNPTNGFAQALIPVTTPFASGTYTAQIIAKTSGGSTLDTVTTASFVVPTTTWLGNTFGIAAAGSVQSPWTPITVNGLVLSVWGRTYTLTGGWGLPQQISSQGHNLLASPVDIDFDIGSGAFNLTPQSLSITSAANDIVRWTGVATGNGITATVNGSLEYDGMMLIALTLAPTSGPVTINTMKLQTAMPAARALFFSWGSEVFGQVVAYNPAVPTSPGNFWYNSSAGIGGKEFNKTLLVPSITLSDDDRGLEWFADSLVGWSVNESVTAGLSFQVLSVDANTNVRLETQLARVAFSLSDARTITFGYEATPIKALPADRRACQIGDVSGAGPAISGLFTAMWSYEGDNVRSDRWRFYGLTPGAFSTIAADTATVRAAETALRGAGVYITPYSQQHTTVAPSTSAPNDSDSVLGFLSQEFAGNTSPDDPIDFGAIQYTSMPTRGSTDYWLASIEYTLSKGIADGIYIDEPYYVANVTAAPVSGSGFTDRYGINRNGYNSLGVRTQLKRLRQLFLNYGKRPVVWLDTSTGYVAPHMWAFADVISDGEGIHPTGGADDFIGNYNTTAGINWLRGISRAAKYGWSTAFLNEVGFADADMRAMYAMLQLFDIDPLATYQTPWVNYMQPRVAFNITHPRVTFVGYWNNAGIATGNANVKCSYYSRPNKIFAHVANLGGSTFNGTITLDISTLGLTGPAVTAIDAETGDAITVTSNTLPLAVASHDYRVVVLTGALKNFSVSFH